MDTKIYDDFEPFCKWQTESTHDVVNVYLQGFRKEQIAIEMKTKDQIIIRGERPLDGSPNRLKRFQKDIRLSPKEYNTQEIDANFEADCLSIFMPKKVRSNIIFADQLVSLKHLHRRPEIGERSAAVKALLAVSLGVALGVLLAYKYSHHSSVSANNEY